jgi:signal transduction histidine kinase
MKGQGLEESLEIKRNFVRHVSHEIRTPLNVVMSGFMLLAEMRDGLGAAGAQVLGEMQSACSAAIDILNDLLTYEKLDSDLLVLDKTVCDLSSIVEDSVRFFRIQATHADITLTLERDISLKPMVVLADQNKLAQALRNLLSNALKFTPPTGSVNVSICSDEATHRVRVVVRDTGAGMTLEERRLLFKEIVQFNPNQLQGGQGSGLGLFLTRHILERHGGVVGVDMDWQGPGSIFYMDMPLSFETLPTKGKPF